MKVIKRDRRKVEFNKQKIVEAIENAFNDIDNEVSSEAKKKSNEIASYI